MIASIKNYFLSAYAELKKVTWPSRKEVISHTIIVVASIAIAMIIVAALDYGLFYLTQILIYR